MNSERDSACVRERETQKGSVKEAKTENWKGTKENVTAKKNERREEAAEMRRREKEGDEEEKGKCWSLHYAAGVRHPSRLQRRLQNR